MRVRLTRKPKQGGQYLTVGTSYLVLGVEADDYRILDDTGAPYLFEPDYFEIDDATEPAFWVSTFGEEGERYAYPEEWNKTGFFEDFFDGVKEVCEQFWLDYSRLYGGKVSNE